MIKRFIKNISHFFGAQCKAYSTAYENNKRDEERRKKNCE